MAYCWRERVDPRLPRRQVRSRSFRMMEQEVQHRRSTALERRPSRRAPRRGDRRRRGRQRPPPSTRDEHLRARAGRNPPDLISTPALTVSSPSARPLPHAPRRMDSAFRRHSQSHVVNFLVEFAGGRIDPGDAGIRRARRASKRSIVYLGLDDGHRLTHGVATHAQGSSRVATLAASAFAIAIEKVRAYLQAGLFPSSLARNPDLYGAQHVPWRRSSGASCVHDQHRRRTPRPPRRRWNRPSAR